MLHALRRLDFPTFGRPTIATCKSEIAISLIRWPKTDNLKFIDLDLIIQVKRTTLYAHLSILWSQGTLNMLTFRFIIYLCDETFKHKDWSHG